MSRVSTEAGDANITKFGDSTESPPLKKLKTDPESEAEEEVPPERRIRRNGKWGDPEFMRQLDIFAEQFEKSEVDLGFM